MSIRVGPDGKYYYVTTTTNYYNGSSGDSVRVWVDDSSGDTYYYGVKPGEFKNEHHLEDELFEI